MQSQMDESIKSRRCQVGGRWRGGASLIVEVKLALGNHTASRLARLIAHLLSVQCECEYECECEYTHEYDYTRD